MTEDIIVGIFHKENWMCKDNDLMYYCNNIDKAVK